ncbi:MAG TPA: nuclear transport factor 2 family protein [Allosphingosinicella sp.]|nr:nuclear transport factor 2 family protein [Allosphingosinicella sp.]
MAFRPWLAFLALLIVGSALDARVPKTWQSALVARENEWSRAMHDGDVKSVDNLLADRWTGEYDGIRIGKRQILKALAAKRFEIHRRRIRDVTIHLTGPSATVAGQDEEMGDYLGRIASGRHVWTDYWGWQAGRWMLVASQSDRVMASAEEDDICAGERLASQLALFDRAKCLPR